MPLFLKYRNLWALGLFHGWLAAVFYFLALGRDPWLELIGTIWGNWNSDNTKLVLTSGIGEIVIVTGELKKIR